MRGWLLALALLAGCVRAPSGGELVKVNIIDQNGMNETIQAKDRLAKLEGVNFLAAQPYKKVLRLFTAREDGKTPALITSYYSSGGVHQLLEVVDGRACGSYCEWFPNGQAKLEVQVLAGQADLDEVAMQSFVFDGLSRAWNEQGELIASIPYSRGVLEGEAHFSHGSELYRRGLLERATYWNEEGVLIASIEGGAGVRACLTDDGGYTLQDYVEGEPSGRVREFNSAGRLVRLAHYLNGCKHGEETVYFPVSGRPRLKVQWRHGAMQGLARSWYPSGQLQSQREMSGNRKEGVSMAWFEDGTLMLLEEYRAEQLVRGEYYGPRGGQPLSRIEEGCGEATLYDEKGVFLQTVAYIDGHPAT